MRKTYSPDFKSKLVLEVLRDKSVINKESKGYHVPALCRNVCSPPDDKFVIKLS